MKHALFALLTLIGSSLLTAQNGTWTVALEPVNIRNMPGVQSFVSAEVDGKILIIGGRRDGLHRRQPPMTFLPSGDNADIILLDVAAQTVRTAPVSTLSSPLNEQMRSTNMQFHRYGDHLVIVGGYGYSTTAGDHITHPRLTVVDVKGLAEDITNGRPIAGRFRTVADERFAVTGGYLGVVNDTLLLVGGHRFDGRYNPMNGPSFTQTYTDAVLRFTVDTSNASLAVNVIDRDVDAEHLHRRDYNLLPQIHPDGTHGYTIYSGVFQHDVDIPFLHPVDITTKNYTARPEFQQYLNHYHCASFAAFDSTAKSSHTFFFGGMSQYRLENEKLIKNDSVPFVKTIARIDRDSNGTFTEHQLSVSMPGLEGSSSEIILDPSLPSTQHGVILLDRLPADTTTVGLLVGGIRSTLPNIFFINDGTQSSASSTIYRVKLIKGKTMSVAPQTVTPPTIFDLKQVSHNDTSVRIDLELFQQSDVYIRISDLQGRLIDKFFEEATPAGKRTFRLPIANTAGALLISVQIEGKLITRITE